MSVGYHKLANGFRIVTEHMPGLKSAALGIWVDAGGRHERSEQNGIAHFLEHMAFKGTKRRTALQIAEEIEDVGGFINAYTSREMTAYYARVLEGDVDLALDLISDILLEPAMDAGEIELERGVILQEIGQVLDTPDDVVFDWLQATAYPGQPLGRTILGPAERVRGFSRDDLLAFTGEHYGPGRLILSASGAVDHARIVAGAQRLFGHLAPVDARPLAPARFESGEWRGDKALEQAHMTLAFETPGYRDDAYYAAQVFATAFGGGMSSRLFQEARERRGLCYSIFAQAGAFADTGMMTIYSGTSGTDLGELAGLCMDEMKRAADDMSAAELERARAQLKAGLLMGLESPAARCERLAKLTAIWDRVVPVEETVARIDGVSVADLRGFAQRLCTSGRMAMALYGPVAGAPELACLKGRLAA